MPFFPRFFFEKYSYVIMVVVSTLHAKTLELSLACSLQTNFINFSADVMRLFAFIYIYTMHLFLLLLIFFISVVVYHLNSSHSLHLQQHESLGYFLKREQVSMFRLGLGPDVWFLRPWNVHITYFDHPLALDQHL